MTNDECLVRRSLRPISVAREQAACGFAAIRHSFVIRHSSFVIAVLSAWVLATIAAPAFPADDGPILSRPDSADQSAPDKADNDKADNDSADNDSAEESSQDESQQNEETDKTQPDEKPEIATQPESVPPPSAEMLALRDRVRHVLSTFPRQAFNTRDNTAAEIIFACLPFGCESQVRRGGPSGARINGITCLCWNYPCAGFELFKTVENRITARVGYGLQQYPSQFLAMLVQSRVPVEYPIRVDQNVRSVADLVEEEKLSCRAGADMSSKLIGLAYYVPPGQTWKNCTGEDWSVERIVQEELAQTAEPDPGGGTHRLMALSYAVGRQIKKGKPVEGQFRRARKYVADFQDHALSLQNPDGSWHPSFFVYRGSEGGGGKGSGAARLYSTGHILEWLVFSLKEDRLQDPQVVGSVGYVTALVGNRRRGWEVTSMATRDIAGLMHALHALAIYNRRVFVPWDPKEPTSATEKSFQQSAFSNQLSDQQSALSRKRLQIVEADG